MTLLRIAQAHVLLWAAPAGGGAAYEVSRTVEGPLLARCPSSPTCPGGGEFSFEVAHEPPAAPCPYAFETRNNCVKARNQSALERALFRTDQVLLTRRLLEALGFAVREEAVDVTEQRVLLAHGKAGPAALDVRMHRSPSAGPIVLVRRRAGGSS